MRKEYVKWPMIWDQDIEIADGNRDCGLLRRESTLSLSEGACGHGWLSLTMTEAKTAAREASLKDNCRTMLDYCMPKTEL